MKKVILNKSYLLDFEQNEVTTLENGKRRKVEPRLMRLLAILAKNKGRVVERNQLIQKIWGNYNSGEKLLTHSISLLRKHFDEQVIHTISKKGYLFEGHLHRVSWIPSYKPAYMLYALFAFLIIRMIFFGHHS